MLSSGSIFLIGELTKIVLDHLNATGQLGTLTEEQAQEIIKQTAANLLTSLPSPEDLEKNGNS